jgi:vitamin B12 transporter
MLRRRRGRWKALAIAACATAAALPAQAVPETVPETILVTASRLPHGLDSGDPNVTVLDAAALEARRASSAVELLRALPGLFVQQSGGRGSVVSLFTRGAKPNFTLVLIDGVKVNDPTNTRGGSFDASTLALDDIARVEFIRGPTSAIYGSDAVGGVINLITRAPDGTFGAELTASGGSDGYWDAGAHVSGSVAGVAGRLGVSHTDNGMPVEGSGLRNTTVDGALAATPLDGLTLSVTGRYGTNRAQSFPDSSGGPLLAVLRGVDRRDIDEGVLGVHARYETGGAWSVLADYGLYDRASEAVSPGVSPSAQTPTGIPANSDDVHFQRNTLTLSARYAPSRRIEAVFGLDLQNEAGTDDGTLNFGGFVLPTHFARSRTQWSGFAEAGIEVTEALRLTGSVRLDSAGREGDHVSPQIAASYDLAETGTKLRLSFGTGYKLPSFYALGNPLVGDPTLKPEHATNWDAGLSQTVGGALVKLDLYDTHYTDLIDFRPGAVPKLVNLSKVHVRGVELSAQIPLGDTLTLTPALSYTDARNATSGAGLRDVPAWLASGTLLWTPRDDVTVSAALFEVGPLTDNAIPTGDVRLSGHLRADASASWRFAPRWEAYVAAENLFDARYQDVVGFPAPGAVVRGGLKLTLQ